MASLTIQKGPNEGATIEISSDETVLGRSEDCDITIPDKAVSGRHCVILRNDRQYRIRDLESTNGTKLNNSLVKESRLKPGDIISIGTVDLLFEGSDVEIEPSEKQAATEPRPVLRTNSSQRVSASSNISGAFKAKRSKKPLIIAATVIIAIVLLVLAYLFVRSL